MTSTDADLLERVLTLTRAGDLTFCGSEDLRNDFTLLREDCFRNGLGPTIDLLLLRACRVLMMTFSAWLVVLRCSGMSSTAMLLDLAPRVRGRMMACMVSAAERVRVRDFCWLSLQNEPHTSTQKVSLLTNTSEMSLVSLSMSLLQR